MLNGFAGKDCELFWGKGGMENQITKTEVSGFSVQRLFLFCLTPDTPTKQSQKAKSTL